MKGQISNGANLDVEANLEARADSQPIKPSTVEQKVKETLNQIGATILEEEKQ